MLIKVWNDNIHPYRERFKGKEVEILPKGFIEMEADDANLFLGSFGAGPRRDAHGNFDPRSFKKLRAEVLPKPHREEAGVQQSDQLQKLVDSLVEKKLAERANKVESPKK